MDIVEPEWWLNGSSQSLADGVTWENIKVAYRPHGTRYTLMSVCLLLISISTFFGNGLICAVIVRSKLYLSTFHATLFVLHAGSCGLGCLGTSVAFCMVSSDQCHLHGPLCVAYGFCIAWMGIGCIFTMAVISYEWRQKLRMISGTPRAKWHVVVRLTAIWSASFLLTSPPLVGWNRYQVEVYSMPACSIDWESKVWSDRLYVAIVFTLGLVLPLSVILHSYIRIIQIIRQISLHSNGDERTLQQHIKLIRMIFVMVLTFCITWLPYGAEALIITFGQKESLLSPDIAVVLMLLAKACVCCNPVVYAYMNSEVRKALKNWKANIVNSFHHMQPD